jgi:hypothetical protein
MAQYEALRILKNCYFDKKLSQRDAVKIWKSYRERVLALAPRNPIQPPSFPFTECECQAIVAHERRIAAGPNACYFQEVLKIHPGDLVARQLDMVIDQSEKYATEIHNEETRINTFLGVGLGFNGVVAPIKTSRRCTDFDLPHFEFQPRITPTGIEFKERDRYVLVVSAPNGRLVLWGGYHRTHSVLAQLGGDAAAVAPLLTKMGGDSGSRCFLFARLSTTRGYLGRATAFTSRFFGCRAFHDSKPPKNSGRWPSGRDKARKISRWRYPSQ